ncbi:MAG: hypothetical protein GTO40_17395 [Deltaproteobacteria bacterium]|nr:hypothetical protein [Deltaproteobacteria bacterium]
MNYYEFLSSRCGVKAETIKKRMQRGMSTHEAMYSPVRGHFRLVGRLPEIDFPHPNLKGFHFWPSG